MDESKYMLKVIWDLQDPLLDLVRQDPVRPHIPLHQRVGPNAQVLVLLNLQHIPQSVVCVSFTQDIPTQEQQLFDHQQGLPTIAVLYTIWALEKGGGQAMIVQAKRYLKIHHPHIQRLVTLSPLTLMATKFHVKNGATLLQINSQTQNFEYSLE